MKKMFILFTSLACVGYLLTYSTQVQANTGDTLEENYSTEQVEAWNQEDYKPLVSDWKGDEDGYVEEAAKGSWNWRAGLICITDAKISGIINHGHAGIVGAGTYQKAVIDSNYDTGVKIHYGSWDEHYSGQVWQVAVRSTSVDQDRQAAEWAAKQVGKPYNWNFFDIWNRKRFYCSQLVWAAYRDTTGTDISLNDYGATIHPFELRDHPNTSLVYRKR